MKQSYYFPHNYNARNDEQILLLRAEHGWNGYLVYWLLREVMAESAETSIRFKSIKAVAFSLGLDVALLQAVVDTAIEQGIFQADADCFWCEQAKSDKDKLEQGRQKRAEAGRKGMESRWGIKNNNVIENDNNVTPLDNKPITNDNKAITSDNTEITDKSRVDKSRVEEIRVEDIDNISSPSEKKKTVKAKTINPSEAEEMFERIWLAYPKKIDKSAVSAIQKMRLAKHGEEQLLRCIDRYLKLNKWHEGKSIEFLKHGGTFFNRSFNDFLDKNYPQTEANEQAKPKEIEPIGQPFDKELYEQRMRDAFAEHGITWEKGRDIYESIGESTIKV